MLLAFALILEASFSIASSSDALLLGKSGGGNTGAEAETRGEDGTVGIPESDKLKHKLVRRISNKMVRAVEDHYRLDAFLF